MFDWFQGLFDVITEPIIDLIMAMEDFLININTLTSNVNSITNGGQSQVRLWLGAFRYVVGDLIYLMYYFISMFGAFYTLFVLINGIIKTIQAAKLSVFKYIKLS